jgi:hypothetical protein
MRHPAQSQAHELKTRRTVKMVQSRTSAESVTLLTEEIFRISNDLGSPRSASLEFRIGILEDYAVLAPSVAMTLRRILTPLGSYASERSNETEFVRRATQDLIQVLQVTEPVMKRGSRR